MAKSVSWGGNLADPLLIVLVIPFVIGVIVLLVASDSGPHAQTPIAGWLCTGITLPLMIVRGVWIWRTQRTLTATDSGFELLSHEGLQDIRDEDITDLSIGQRSETGVSTNYTIRTIRLAYDLNGVEEILEFEQRAAHDEGDTFGTALDRVVEKIASRAVSKIRSKKRFSAADCALDLRELVIGKYESELVVDLRDIEKVEFVNDTVSIWANGRKKPVFERSAAKPGVLVLHRVLSELLAKPKASSAAPVARADFATASPDEEIPVAEFVPIAEAVPVPGPKPAPVPGVIPAAAAWSGPSRGAMSVEDEEAGLGSLVFTRKSAENTTLSNAIASILCATTIVCGIGMTAHGFLNQWKTPMEKFLGYAGPFVILVGIGMAINQWLRTKELFQCFRNGIVYTTWHSQTQFMFREITSFTYTCTRIFVNMVYRWTEVKLVFHHSNESPAFTYETTFVTHDPAFDQLRDHISSMLARHFLKRLSEGEQVRWTSELTFTPGQLVIKRGAKSGKASKERVVPFGELGDHEFHNGVFHLLPKTGVGLPITVEVSEPNFFPGYFLFLLLTNSKPRIPTSESNRPGRDEPWKPTKPSAPESAGSHFEGWK